jgi:hypothetical protein
VLPTRRTTTRASRNRSRLVEERLAAPTRVAVRVPRTDPEQRSVAKPAPPGGIAGCVWRPRIDYSPALTTLRSRRRGEVGGPSGSAQSPPTPDPTTTHLRRHRCSRPTDPRHRCQRDSTQVTAIAHLRSTGELGGPHEVVALRVGGSSPFGRSRSPQNGPAPRWARLLPSSRHRPHPSPRGCLATA